MTQALVWSDDRAQLLTEDPQRYRLALADGTPLVTFGEADAAGVAWLAEEPEGWASPEVDLPLDDKPDGHGAQPGDQSYAARVLSIAGSAEAPDLRTARRARQRLIDALTSTVRTGGELLWTHLDDEPAKSLRVLLNGRPNVAQDGRWVDYAFVLVAADPLKFGAAATYGPVRLLATQVQPSRTYSAGARTYDAGSTAAARARTYTGGNLTATVARVSNAGTEPAHAVYTITGPVPTPTVLLGTGEFATLALDLAATDTAIIDTEFGTVEVNGVNRYDAFAAGSTFPLIPGGRPDATGTVVPAVTEVRLTSSTGTDPAAGLTITTAPRWT